MRPRAVAIVGTGLIGTSVGLALRRHAKPRIAGWDPDRRALAAAKRAGGITRAARSMEDALSCAEVVVLAAPLDAVVRMVPSVLGSVAPGTLVIDVAGVKRTVLRAAGRSRRPDVAFVAGHPLAGRETAGAAAADAALFDGRPFALVAEGRAGRKDALERAGRFARALGAVPVVVTAREHDRIVAATSALPQLASVALAIAADRACAGRAHLLAGPGYRDATRLAESPFGIWGAVLAANRSEVKRAMRGLQSTVRSLAGAIARSDDRAMERLFSQARAARRRVVAKSGKNQKRLP